MGQRQCFALQVARYSSDAHLPKPQPQPSSTSPPPATVYKKAPAATTTATANKAPASTAADRPPAFGFFDAVADAADPVAELLVDPPLEPLLPVAVAVAAPLAVEPDPEPA